MLDTPSLMKKLLAFLAVYVIWGSTYISIAFAIETLPPFMMLALRFGVAGAILYGGLRLRGTPPPLRAPVLHAFWVGALSLGVGTGAVAWAEQHVASGVIALVVTTVPFWMVLIDWKFFNGGAPVWQVVLGLVLGAIGIGILAGPDLRSGAAGIGVLAVLFGSASWSIGSMQSKRSTMPQDPLMSAAAQMIGAGLFLAVVSAAWGEWSGFSPTDVTARSFLSWAYLVVFGSLVGYSAYVWLLKHVPSKQVASYAFVNPVVAVLLGWWLASETLTPRTGLAMCILTSAVALIVYFGRDRRARVDPLLQSET
ncbi:MAG: EamA family transporter [Rhodothermales bacterium]